MAQSLKNTSMIRPSKIETAITFKYHERNYHESNYTMRETTMRETTMRRNYHETLFVFLPQSKNSTADQSV